MGAILTLAHESRPAHAVGAPPDRRTAGPRTAPGEASVR